MSGISAIYPSEILSPLTFIASASQPEYDAFTTLGNPGWDWDSINAHINAVETFYPFAASPPNNLHPLKASAFQAIDDPANHGSTGPIQVSYSNFWRIPGRVIKGFLDSLVAVGVPRNGHAVSTGVHFSTGSAAPGTLDEIRSRASIVSLGWR